MLALAVAALAVLRHDNNAIARADLLFTRVLLRVRTQWSLAPLASPTILALAHAAAIRARLYNRTRAPSARLLVLGIWTLWLLASLSWKANMDMLGPSQASGL